MCKLLANVSVDVVANNILQINVHGHANALGLGAVHIRAHVDLLDGGITTLRGDLLDLTEGNFFLGSDFLACFPDHFEGEALGWQLNHAVVAEGIGRDLGGKVNEGCAVIVEAGAWVWDLNM